MGLGDIFSSQKCQTIIHEQRVMVEGKKQLPYLGALAGIVATRAVTVFSVQRHDLSGEDTRGVAELGPGEDLAV